MTTDKRVSQSVRRPSKSWNPSTSKAYAVIAVALAAQLAAVQSAAADRWYPQNRFDRTAKRVANMVRDRHASHLAQRHGLDLVNVSWEDTGRYLDSSVGPHISDVTIEVEAKDYRGRRQNYLMPVLRHPNFTDKTGDVDIDKFYLRVGNHDGDRLETISLRELLRRPHRYMTLPRDGRIVGGTLLSDRDHKVLTSAQAAFLPIPRRGHAKFYPVVFNYQSSKDNPAVLTILATRQGTSMTIIDNSRDTIGAGSWGQRLYFNNSGDRAPLIAERLTDVDRRGTTVNGESAAELGKDSNLLMIIQIPLQLRRHYRVAPPTALDMAPNAEGMAPQAASPDQKSMALRERSDVDVAVLGHGPSEGPYTELDGLTIRRDTRFPVRVTVQFYQATSNGIVNRADVRRLARQINKVYDHADYIGSLVVPETPGRRPTEWYGPHRSHRRPSIYGDGGAAERNRRHSWKRRSRSASKPQGCFGLCD